MRIPYFIFFLFMVGINLCAQVKPIDLKITESFKEIKLDKVIEQISKKYQIQFAYDPDYLNKFTITKEFYNIEFYDCMKKIFEQTPFIIMEQTNSHFLISIDKSKLDKTNFLKSNNLKINGTVRNSRNGEPLENVSVILFPNGISVNSDEHGHFEFSVAKVSNQNWLEFRYLSYEVKRMQLTNNMNSTVEIYLIPIIQKLNSVNINEKAIESIMFKNKHSILNQSTLNQFKIPEISNDVMNFLKREVGIDATNDLSSGLNIRGSDDYQHLILLDGISLYKAEHFYGLFSAINPNILSNIDLYKSYFPAEYGGRTSSLLKMKSMADINKIGGGVDLNLLYSNLHVKIPIHSNFGLLVGARFSNQNLGKSNVSNLLFQNAQNSSEINQLDREKQSLIAINPLSNFYDIFIKVYGNITSRLNFSLSYLQIEDQYKAEYTNEYQVNNLFFNENFSEFIKWKSSGISNQFKFTWNSKIYTTLSTSFSRYSFNQMINSSLTETDRNFSKLTSQFNKNSNRLSSINLTLKNSLSINSMMLINFGYEGNWYSDSLSFATDGKIFYRNRINNSRDQNGFIELLSTPHQKIEIRTGIRLCYYNITNKMYIDPRIALSYKLNTKSILGINFGLYHQFLSQTTQEDRFGRPFDYYILTDEKLYKVPVSYQCELFYKVINSYFNINLSIYNKFLKGATNHIFVTPTFVQKPGSQIPNPRYIILSGLEETYGAESELIRKWKAISMTLSYSYNKSYQSFDSLNKGTFFPTQAVRTHQVKMGSGFKNSHWFINLFYVYGSGHPYTDISLIQSNKDRRELTVKESINYLPDYKRIDTDLQFYGSLKKFNYHIGISIYNVFDWENVKYVQYIYSLPIKNPNQGSNEKVVGAQINLIPRTFNFSIGINF